MRRPTRRTTAAMMRHPGVSMILATGGAAMVNLINVKRMARPLADPA